MGSKFRQNVIKSKGWYKGLMLGASFSKNDHGCRIVHIILNSAVDVRDHALLYILSPDVFTETGSSSGFLE